MKTTEQAQKELRELTDSAKPLIKLLAENYHPHHTVIVTSTGVELLEGKMSNPNITEFLKD